MTAEALSFWNKNLNMFYDFVDYVFNWTLVDDKPKILLDILHETNRDLYPAIYSIISILRTLHGAISNKQYL
jgi:hypothetical protein